MTDANSSRTSSLENMVKESLLESYLVTGVYTSEVKTVTVLVPRRFRPTFKF